MVAALAYGDDGDVRHAGIGVDQHGQFIGVDLAHRRRTQNGRGRVVLQHGQGISRLRAVYDVKAFLFELVGDSPRKKHVGVDQQDRGRIDAGGAHAGSSSAMRRSMSTTSMVSLPTESTPVTYSDSSLPGKSGTQLASSHSPVTGMAVDSRQVSNWRLAIK